MSNRHVIDSSLWRPHSVHDLPTRQNKIRSTVRENSMTPTGLLRHTKQNTCLKTQPQAVDLIGAAQMTATRTKSAKHTSLEKSVRARSQTLTPHD